VSLDVKGLRAQIAAATNQSLSDELVDAFEELKRRYSLRDFRPGVLEAGRFAEAAFRVLEYLAAGRHTGIGKTLPKVHDLCKTLESADAKKVHESVRIHIPRVLASVYNIRNRRDIGHIAADVDANSMDSTYVVSACNWVLAELVRLVHKCDANEAQEYVEGIVKRQAPLVEVFSDEPLVLHTGLSDRDEILLLLYHQGATGAGLDQLDTWTPKMKRNVIGARLSDLEKTYRFIRRKNGRAYITQSGAEHVESKILRAV
jgi:hypothetical protein